MTTMIISKKKYEKRIARQAKNAIRIDVTKLVSIYMVVLMILSGNDVRTKRSKRMLRIIEAQSMHPPLLPAVDNSIERIVNRLSLKKTSNHY
jgi:hypothetical protein